MVTRLCRASRCIAVVGIIALAASVSGASASPRAPPLFPAADAVTTRAIERELVSAIDAYNRGDLDGYARLYADAPDLVYVYRGEVLNGFARLRADFAARFFTGVPATGRPESDQVVVRLQWLHRLGDGDLLATVEVRARVAGAAAAAGVSSLVFRRVAGRWRVVYEHTS